MKKLITFYVVVLLLHISTTMRASTPAQFHVHQTSGEVYSLALCDVSSLTFSPGKLLVNVQPVKEIPIAGIRKITFDRPTAVDNVQVGASCYTSVNNGVITVVANQVIHALQVVSLTGQVILAQQYISGPESLEIDANMWAQGMYILLIQTAQGNVNTKIMLH